MKKPPSWAATRAASSASAEDAAQGSGPCLGLADALEYGRCAVEEGVDLLVDQAVQVLRHRQPVDPLAHADIENRRMQAPDEFNLVLVLLRGGRGDLEFAPHLGQHQVEDAFAQALQVALVDAFAGQAGEDEDADPVAF